MKRKKVLLVYVNYSGFVRSDEEILSSLSDVTRYRFKPVKGIIKTARELIRQFFFLIAHTRHFDFILIWFADTHAFLPVWVGKWFKISTAIAIGGFDAVSIPYLKYGLYCSNLPRQFFARYAIRNSTFLLPVDGSLVENTNIYADPSGKGLPVGIRNFVKNITGKIITLPTGYNFDFWKANPDVSRSDSVVTVGIINNLQRWYLKGCDLLQQTAAELPVANFHIYGLTETMLEEMHKSELPRNFHLHGMVEPKDLPDIYSTHKIYALFSLSEGLPNVLCEAMLCGCIPVGSDVNGIPPVIGDDRLIISRKEVKEAVRVIQFALSQSEYASDHFRNRIIECFPRGKRASVFREII
jgi:glycosyltransferase involved in cell wall biosynthesis